MNNSKHPLGIRNKFKHIVANRKFLVALIVGIVTVAIAIGLLIHGANSNKDIDIAKQNTSDVTTDVASSEDDNADTDANEDIGQEEPDDTETVPDDSTDSNSEQALETEDPQSSANQQAPEVGATVNVSSMITSNEDSTSNSITYGIDVSKYQGYIDWDKVAAAGIDYAMIRVGYRTQSTGEIYADSSALYNMQEATANDIKIGVYFFSTAITTAEAVEEANWVANYISKYQITYPVVYNCEGFDSSSNRQYSLTTEERSNIAMAYLAQVAAKGYTPMFYASKNELTDNAKWNTTTIASKYKIWVSQYPATAYPETSASSYSGTHHMWQYTNQGSVPGIDASVDLDIAYFGYDSTANAISDEAPEVVEGDVTGLMTFTTVNEQVTAKSKTNLRDRPSQADSSTVMAVLTNGQIATQTGISDSGWARVEYNGTTYYAVSSYLTTDIDGSSDADDSGSDDSAIDPDTGTEVTTIFSDINDIVTAKSQVNLRSLPSVTNPNSVVIATLNNGTSVTRTGINSDLGWSRVVYNGQVLYCITSYLTLVE